MSRDELLKMLEDHGMDDDAIKALLKEALDSLDHEFEEHDEKEAEKREEEDAKAAGELLGVEL